MHPGEVEPDVNEHVLLATDHAASTGRFEQGAGIDIEAGTASACSKKLEYASSTIRSAVAVIS